MRDPDLWRRLDAFDLDGPGATGALAARVARRLGWTDAYAAATLAELRRFLYLAAVADRETKPSAPIEAAWAALRAERPAAWAALVEAALAGRAPRPPPRFASHYTPQDGIVGLVAGGALARLAGRRLAARGPARAPLGAGRGRRAA